jgi:hypothetical protein
VANTVWLFPALEVPVWLAWLWSCVAPFPAATDPVAWLVPPVPTIWPSPMVITVSADGEGVRWCGSYVRTTCPRLVSSTSAARASA